jgi:hypothetical protein
VANEDSRPIPDPTELTAQALREAREFTIREVGSVQELLETKIEAQREVLDEKVIAYDEKVKQIETMRVEAKGEDRQRIEDALAALKELLATQSTASEKAIDKAEQATKEHLLQLEAKFATDIRRLEDGIAANKERTGEVAQAANGISQQRIGGQASIRGLYGAIAAAAAFIAIVVAVANILSS